MGLESSLCSFVFIFKNHSALSHFDVSGSVIYVYPEIHAIAMVVNLSCTVEALMQFSWQRSSLLNPTCTGGPPEKPCFILLACFVIS